MFEVVYFLANLIKSDYNVDGSAVMDLHYRNDVRRQ